MLKIGTGILEILIQTITPGDTLDRTCKASSLP